VAPISETGRTGHFQSGYTLLEILAVFILLGIVGLITFPLLNTGEEKAYVQSIGKLVKADLSLVREEAVCEKSSITVEFSQNGYFFSIGEIEIRRTFDKFRFTWLPLSVTPEDIGEGTEDETKDEVGSQPDPLQMKFNTDGVCRETLLQWETNHFQGELSLTQEGSVNWHYAAK
jgi:type II secretory pathway pseudopilin PulG